jgi:hypothetical protein
VPPPGVPSLEDADRIWKRKAGTRPKNLKALDKARPHRACCDRNKWVQRSKKGTNLCPGRLQCHSSSVQDDIPMTDARNFCEIWSMAWPL